MMVQAVPTAPLEVVEPEFLLHLLVALFAHPTRFDPGCQGSQRCIGGQVAQVVFLLTSGPAFANQPNLFAGQRCAVALWRPIGNTDPHRCKLRRQWSLGAGAPGDTMPGRGF